MREPSQVFILLETVYRSFDQIAKKRRVFKVETVGTWATAIQDLIRGWRRNVALILIHPCNLFFSVSGDCYVAVAGLPDPREDHAVVMARFARECLAQMSTSVESTTHLDVEGLP